MRKRFIHCMLALFFAACSIGVYAQENSRPFRGVWINNADETYTQLSIDLYDRSITVEGEAAACYGYLQMENDFVSDYWIITDVTSLDDNRAVVRYYSLRYGMPESTETMTLTRNAADGTIAFGEAYSFKPSDAFKYVEVTGANVNIRTAPKTGTPIMKAQRGMMFEAAGIAGGWYGLRLSDGRIGYVSDKYSEPRTSDCYSIPDRVFTQPGSYADFANSVQNFVGFNKKGDDVYMHVDKSLVDADAGTMRYFMSTVYKGRIIGNTIVFTKSLDGWMVSPDSDVNDADLKDIAPYIIYYSPYSDTFIIDGYTLNWE